MNGEESVSTGIFDVASNSTRIEILRALAGAYREAPMDPWLEYSDLQAAVGIRDNGNFNYHLDQLDDLVVKGSAGYRLSRVGMQVVSAVSSGVTLSLTLDREGSVISTERSRAIVRTE